MVQRRVVKVLLLVDTDLKLLVLGYTILPSSVTEMSHFVELLHGTKK
jgi:hypothetical protein